jgi:hypothetical protein
MAQRIKGFPPWASLIAYCIEAILALNEVFVKSMVSLSLNWRKAAGRHTIGLGTVSLRDNGLGKPYCPRIEPCLLFSLKCKDSA